jgi:hypothetical protein
MAWDDIFISYKGEQESWTRRLHEDLTRLGYSVFYDHGEGGLRADAQGFDDQLRARMRNARHLVLMWSDDIGADSYVIREIDLWKEGPSGRSTVVLLDDVAVSAQLPAGAHNYREFIPLKQTYGSEGAEKVPTTEWNKAVLRLVREALDDGQPRADRLTEIPLVVVAMTSEQAAELDEGQNAAVAQQTLDEVLQLSFVTGRIDSARYGATALDWQPFRAGESIGSLVNRFEVARRRHRADDDRLLPRWPLLVSYDHVLTATNPTDEELDRLQQDGSLVVVDSMSLLHRKVRDAVVQVGLHTAPNASILGIGPVLPAPESPAESYEQLEKALFTELLMNRAHERSRGDFHPGVGGCVFNITRSYDLARWLHMAADHTATWTAERWHRMHPGHAGQLYDGPSHAPVMGSGGA